MISGATASIRLKELDSGTLEDLRAGEHLLFAGVAAHGDNVRVLDQEQPVTAFPTLAFLDDLLLKKKGFLPAHSSQVEQFVGAHEEPLLTINQKLMDRPSTALKASPSASYKVGCA
jgi:hypothetical protein